MADATSDFTHRPERRKNPFEVAMDALSAAKENAAGLNLTIYDPDPHMRQAALNFIYSLYLFNEYPKDATYEQIQPLVAETRRYVADHNQPDDTTTLFTLPMHGKLALIEQAKRDYSDYVNHLQTMLNHSEPVDLPEKNEPYTMVRCATEAQSYITGNILQGFARALGQNSAKCQVCNANVETEHGLEPSSAVLVPTRFAEAIVGAERERYAALVARGRM